jgi:hypothetical protein
MRRRYATKAQVAAAVEAARELGLIPMDGPASIELAPDGRIRLSPPPAAEVDEWSKLAADARA